MKDLFPGHFKESEIRLREIWGTSLFVFDANILLNLYRYSDTTRSEFLRILEKIKDRAWIPHRAAEEYLNNRLSVIDQQERSYDETQKSIETLKSDLENARQHPFVSNSTMAKVSRVFDELCEELNKNKAVHTNRISNDEIKGAISAIFENRVGSPYEKDKLVELISEGEERYRQKIPPGFKDGSKSGDSEIFVEKCRKYGDLIVWAQVIDKAIDSGKGVVLVTDDKKEDWWEKFKGRTVGPRPELIKEFKDRANSTFHMYQADRFLELARENLDEQVSDEIVEEIREVRRRDKLANKRRKEMEYLNRRKIEMNHLFQELEHSKHKLMSHEKELQMLQQRMQELDAARNNIRHRQEHLSRDDIENPDFERFMNQYSALSAEHAQVRNNLERSSIEYKEMQIHMIELENEVAHRMKIIEQENPEDS
ncbi:PIN-like domain-containing protein [Halomonas sp. M5N1S17]|uniref:PIN-like domain-containing protein n=1 Tax=Halomonas alkalisoli TaxID=2907158 RepID=UPI001F3BB708|nr:PIN-like domain-containing protein [Halomonas alkalisoli]MCE9662970.1 PIN-like domain-containing protein [Halomonas alkalisoli]